MQLKVEKCSSININPLQKTIKKLIKRDYPDSPVEEVYVHTLNELKKFSVNDQLFKYKALKNHLGGHRWFFLCPKCGKRANKLFLPPNGTKNRERKYLCKICHKLKNQSALQGQNNMYRKVTKPLKRMKEIQDKINRGHLKSEKVQQLLSEHDALENELKNSPEYRLYTFKKKYNNVITS